MIQLLLTLWLLTFSSLHAIAEEKTDEGMLSWKVLSELPDALGVAGPFAGVHGDALIVAGGANFPKPVWESQKIWRDRIHVLVKTGEKYTWKEGGTLPKPIAYGAAVSTPEGVVCIGGNDEENTFAEVFLLSWNSEANKIVRQNYPALPEPCAFGMATLIGNVIYLAGGQSGSGLDSATNNFWSLDLSQKENETEFKWNKLEPWPGKSRAFNLTIGQHNGFHNCVYVLSGRRMEGEAFELLKDVWEFNTSTKKWRQRADVPQCVMAGTGIAWGQSHLFVLGGADGKLMSKVEDLKDDHPGFPKTSFAYHTIKNTWTTAGSTPANHVTTHALRWGDRIVIPSGEIRPRVRSPKVWAIQPQAHSQNFGM